MWLDFAVRQKLTQLCKSTILQLKKTDKFYVPLVGVKKVPFIFVNTRKQLNPLWAGVRASLSAAQAGTADAGSGRGPRRRRTHWPTLLRRCRCPQWPPRARGQPLTTLFSRAGQTKQKVLGTPLTRNALAVSSQQVRRTWGHTYHHHTLGRVQDVDHRCAVSWGYFNCCVGSEKSGQGEKHIRQGWQLLHNSCSEPLEIMFLQCFPEKNLTVLINTAYPFKSENDLLPTLTWEAKGKRHGFLAQATKKSRIKRAMSSALCQWDQTGLVTALCCHKGQSGVFSCRWTGPPARVPGEADSGRGQGTTPQLLLPASHQDTPTLLQPKPTFYLSEENLDLNKFNTQ